MWTEITWSISVYCCLNKTWHSPLNALEHNENESDFFHYDDEFDLSTKLCVYQGFSTWNELLACGVIWSFLSGNGETEGNQEKT